jgi:AcrR family transcriptional regulator
MMNTKEKILQAADELFGSVGFEAATTREIVEKSGVNKATLYYHYDSKEDLLASLLDDYYEKLGNIIQVAISRGGGDFKRSLSNVIDAYVDFLAENRNFSLIIQREASLGRYIDRMADNLKPILKTGQQILHGNLNTTQNGEMETHHVLISFYSMIVGYFTYREVIEKLTGRDILQKNELEKLKRHLRHMVDLVESDLKESGTEEK